MNEKQKKSIEKYLYQTFSDDLENDIIEVSGKLLSIEKFDVKGNLILSKTYNKDEEIAEHIERKYEDNLLVEEIIFMNGEVVEKHEFKYNSDNLIDREIVIYSDETKETWYYKYNNQKKLIEKRSQPESDEYIVYLFEYENNKILSEKEFENEEHIIEKNYKYDENGNLIAFLFKDIVEEKEMKVINEYDTYGNKLRELKYDSQDRLVNRLSFKYDENKRLIKKVEDTTYSSISLIFEYNELGMLIEQKEVNENEDVISTLSFIYEGAELVETQSEGKSFSDCFIIKNEIEYY